MHVRILFWILIHRMKEPVEMNEVAEKMSCNFPLHGLAFVATDATLPLVNLNSKIPLKRGYWNKWHELTGKKRSQTDVSLRPRLLDFALSLDEDVIVYVSQKEFESLHIVSKSIYELTALKGSVFGRYRAMLDFENSVLHLTSAEKDLRKLVKLNNEGWFCSNVVNGFLRDDRHECLFRQSGSVENLGDRNVGYTDFPHEVMLTLLCFVQYWSFYFVLAERGSAVKFHCDVEKWYERLHGAISRKNNWEYEIKGRSG
ncbi:hypothetical protein Tco_0743255 [Tanacetum coccineum]